MPYVQRDENKKIIGIYAAPQKGYAEEFLKDEDPEVIAYLNPVKIPEITPLQARRALNAAGMREQIEQFIKDQDQDIQDAWQYAQIILRTDELLNAAVEKLGMSQDQVDELFKTAAEM